MSSCKQQVSVETWGEYRRDEGVSKLPSPPSSTTLTSLHNICWQIANQKGGGGGGGIIGTQASRLRYFAFPAFLFSWLPPFSPFSIAKYLAFLRKFPLFFSFPIILELPPPALSFPPPVTLFSRDITSLFSPTVHKLYLRLKRVTWASFKNAFTRFVVPPKFCVSIVFSFSWGDCQSQEKLKTMLIA